MGVATIAGQPLNRLGHERGAKPCFSATVLVMNLKKLVLVCGVQSIVKLPVHLQLTVGVLMVVLIGSPAQFQHIIADFADHIIAAHHRLLIVAGFRRGIIFIGNLSPVRGQQKEFCLDPGLYMHAFGGGLCDQRRSTLRGAWATILALHDAIAWNPCNSLFQGS